MLKCTLAMYTEHMEVNWTMLGSLPATLTQGGLESNSERSGVPDL